MKATITIEIEESKSLSDQDKTDIKQAVLQSAAANVILKPEDMATSLIKAFKTINQV